MPPANTLVRWVNENAFVSEVQTRPCPTLGRPVHLGLPPSIAARYFSSCPSDSVSYTHLVSACPPYLRRPSEDWYTLLLMVISSASAFAVALPFLTFGILTAFGVDSISHRRLVWISEGLIAWLAAAYLEFAWLTRFCYRLDLERKRKFTQAQYVFFSKHGQSFPWPLHRLDSLANSIERRYSDAQAKRAQAR